MQTFMIHSSGLSGRQWQALVRALPGPCHAPDLIGYPYGPPWSEGPALSADVEYLLQLVDEARGPIDVVGHSYGGALALHVALKRPDRIRRIVVHDPVLWGSVLSDGNESCRREIMALAESDIMDPEMGGSPQWMRRFIEFWGGRGAWDAMSAQHQEAFLKVGRKVFQEVYDLGMDQNPASVFDAIDAPILFAMGEQSPAVAQEVSRVLAARGDKRKLVTIPGGHMSPVTSPGRFVVAAVAFLTAEVSGYNETSLV